MAGGLRTRRRTPSPANAAAIDPDGAFIAELLIVRRHEPLTTSLIMAQRFGKRHSNVLRAIETLECSDGFSRLNFEPRDYLDDRGKRQPLYHITESGFAFLALGFTGREAAAWKERFIGAFQTMRQVLQRQLHAEWQQPRLDGKQARTDLTDALQRLEVYARTHGSQHPEWFYVTYTRLLNRELFICVDLSPVAFRDSLDRRQLAKLRVAETMVADLIDEAIAAGVPYKTIYAEAKRRVATYASTVGRSTVLAVTAHTPSPHDTPVLLHRNPTDAVTPSTRAR